MQNSPAQAAGLNTLPKPAPATDPRCPKHQDTLRADACQPHGERPRRQRQGGKRHRPEDPNRTPKPRTCQREVHTGSESTQARTETHQATPRPVPEPAQAHQRAHGAKRDHTPARKTPRGQRRLRAHNGHATRTDTADGPHPEAKARRAGRNGEGPRGHTALASHSGTPWVSRDCTHSRWLCLRHRSATTDTV